MGDYLRAARRRRRIGIERAAEETRIRNDFLMRMESDEFDFLAPTYVRGFLKSYARYLRVDPDPLLAEFDSRFGAGRFESQQIMALERHGQRARPPRKKMSSWAASALMALVVLVALGIVGLASGGGDDDGPRVAATEGATPEAEESASASPEPTASATSDVGLAFDEGVTVEVVAVTGDCWVLAAEDGVDVNPAGDTIVQGESMTFEGEEKVFIRLGAPWAVELIVNGRNIGSPGGNSAINLNFPDDLDTL
jgi:hypothetical protein